MIRHILLGIGLTVLSVVPAVAQEPAMRAELAALRQKYQDTIQPIAAHKEQKIGDLKKEYVLALEKGQKDIMASGDLDAALAYRAERERILGDEATTDDEKKAMPRPLATLRSSYEKGIARIESDSAVEAQKVTDKYVLNLQVLEKALTSRGDLDGALQVRAERGQFPASNGRPVPQPQPLQAPASKNLLPTMTATNQCEKKAKGSYVVLTAPHRDMTYIQTDEKFKPPFRAKIKARTDSTNVRLYYANGMVIFNWEAARRELRVHDPVTGAGKGVSEKGYISENKWHDIVWEVRPDGMKITVDGDTRYEGLGDYSALQAPLGIGPSWGSVVSVESFVVE